MTPPRAMPPNAWESIRQLFAAMAPIEDPPLADAPTMDEFEAMWATTRLFWLAYRCFPGQRDYFLPIDLKECWDQGGTIYDGHAILWP